jgi:hypothetical protein
LRRLRKGAAMKHDGREIKAALRTILTTNGLETENLMVGIGLRPAIHDALDYIIHLEGELRRARFSDYDLGEE